MLSKEIKIESNTKLYYFSLTSNIVNFFLTIILTIFGFPLLLNYFSTDQYTFWIIISSIVIYTNIFGFGLDSSSQILISLTKSFNNKINIFKKSLVLSISISCFFLLIYILITIFNYNWFSLFFKLPEDIFSQIINSTHILIIFTFLNLTIKQVTLHSTILNNIIIQYV
jgi:Na+-driven multidrug efflux pump